MALNSSYRQREVLLEKDLKQIAAMCAVPHHPDVITIEQLSTKRIKKLVVYNKASYVIQYNKNTKKVKQLTEDPFCGPFPLSYCNTPRLKDMHKKHTRKRLRERFNINATDADLQSMADMCRTKYLHIKFPFITPSQRPGRSKNLIHFKGTDILAVYEEGSNSIVTAMPTKYLHKEEREWLYCSKRVRYKQLLKHTKEPLQ